MRLNSSTYFILLLAVCCASIAGGDVVVKTDATWKATSPAPPAGWNTSVSFDDSAWQNAFKSPTGDHIWLTSNQSGQAPNQVWFRHVFVLDQTVASAVGDFYFDDNGENYLNGHLIINDPGGGATNFPNTTIDPTFFTLGENLFAIHGIDTIAPFNNVSANIRITYVPEPGTIALLLFGAIVLCRRSFHTE